MTEKLTKLGFVRLRYSNAFKKAINSGPPDGAGDTMTSLVPIIVMFGEVSLTLYWARSSKVMAPPKNKIDRGKVRNSTLEIKGKRVLIRVDLKLITIGVI